MIDDASKTEEVSLSGCLAEVIYGMSAWANCVLMEQQLARSFWISMMTSFRIRKRRNFSTSGYCENLGEGATLHTGEIESPFLRVSENVWNEEERALFKQKYRETGKIPVELRS